MAYLLLYFFHLTQIKFFDLHVRYEDDKTFSDPFACGIHLKILSSVTTNSKWVSVC